MKPRADQIDKLEAAFKAAHGKEVSISVGPAWEEKVMRAVRRLDVQPAGGLLDPEALGHLVWRFAAATCVVALILMAYTMAGDLGGTSEVARLFFEDPLIIDVVHYLEAV
jgi:hypothetical protein